MKSPRLPKRVVKHLMEIYWNKTEMYEWFSSCEDVNNIIKYISKNVDLENKTILDLGAGTGRLSIPLSKRAKFVYALDKSKPMLKILRRKIKAKKIKNIKPIESGFNKIPLPKESIDVVTSLWSFPVHSNNWERDLREVKRILRMDGKTVLIDTHYSGEYHRINKKVHEPDFFPSMEKFNRDFHKWMELNKFKHKIITILIDFGSKRNVEKLCGPFFGYEVSTYLLARDKTSFHLNLSVFYGKK